MRNQRWPNGSRNTATRPAGGLSSGPRSRVTPFSTTRAATASQSSTVRCRLTSLPPGRVRGRHARRLELVGHHPARPVHGELAVADPAVVHHDRLVDHLGPQRGDVPLDRGAAVGHAEVRRQLTHRSPPLLDRLHERPEAALIVAGAVLADAVRHVGRLVGDLGAGRLRPPEVRLDVVDVDRHAVRGGARRDRAGQAVLGRLAVQPDHPVAREHLGVERLAVVLVHLAGSEPEDLHEEPVRRLDVPVDEQGQPPYGGPARRRDRQAGRAAPCQWGRRPRAAGPRRRGPVRARGPSGPAGRRARRGAVGRCASRSVSSGATSATGVPRERWRRMRYSRSRVPASYDRRPAVGARRLEQPEVLVVAQRALGQPGADRDLADGELGGHGSTLGPDVT